MLTSGTQRHWTFESAYENNLDPRQSGLTPDFFNSGGSVQPLTPKANYIRSEREVRQKEELLGHTIEHLYHMEAIEAPGMRASNLQNTILPNLQRQNWAPSVIAKREDGRPYDVRDNDVWQALEPCLKLITRFATDAHLEEW